MEWRNGGKMKKGSKEEKMEGRQINRKRRKKRCQSSKWSEGKLEGNDLTIKEYEKDINPNKRKKERKKESISRYTRKNR